MPPVTVPTKVGTGSSPVQSAKASQKWGFFVSGQWERR
jgi:hypothetical protein